MTSKFDMSADHDPNPTPDSFTEPRTIPEQWDVSAFITPSTPVQNGSTDQPAESTHLASNNPVGDGETDSTFDPFPEPRTIPGNWDVSDLV